MTDTDDATIEEARKVLAAGVGPWAYDDATKLARITSGLISIAIRRGEERDRLDRANAAGAEALKKAWVAQAAAEKERDALAEENEHLRRAARVADSGQITTEQALALAGLNKVEAEKQHARITALAEQNRKLREAAREVVAEYRSHGGPGTHQECVEGSGCCMWRDINALDSALSGGTE